DDFSLMYLEENCGVFSSNRIGGVGSDDIYLFKLKDVNIEVVGRVLSFSKPVADAIVIIKDVETEAVDTLVTDSSGVYHYPAMEKDKQYKIFAYKDDYLIPTGKLINTQGVTKSIIMDSKHGFEMDFDMRKIEQNKEYEIHDIYYDVDKYEFRPEYLDELENLVSLLNNNPEICIQVNSHTDERASDIYNLILSNNRAKAVVDFLNSRGVDMNRLTWKGWGETSPIYPNAVTDEEHQANRRTTFTIINFEQLQLAKKAEEHNETIRKVERAGKQEPKENGLYFRVQIAAMTNKNNTLFKKVNKNMPGVPTYCSKDSDGLYKYTVGMFTTFQEASFMKDEIDNLGYNSFIVAYENGNRLPINEVIQLQLKEKK
ncbi:MAG: OmpA family protein, partial [Bacteroidales bacterium]|nr:OmpA family protein [Bacteroidales bacterium]